MFLPANTKLVTEQAVGGSDIVCYMIKNYTQIFSTEYEYCLGDEADIQLDDPREGDSDSGADHTLDKYGDGEDEVGVDDRDEEGAEPITPDFSLSPVDGSGGDTVFTHSDSSLNTNDSDELKLLTMNNKLNLPHQSAISNASAATGGSKSSPNSPMLSRRKKMVEKSLSTDNKLNSDWSDQEADNENFQRRLLRQPRQKRLLSSTTTSAELIEHKRHMTDSSSASITSGEGAASPNSSSHSIPPSAATLVPERHVISQPIIQHFATEYRPTPNVIFHAVDRRRQPAAPSYEEHIQRTQSKSRVVATTATARQPVVAHTSVVQHQSSPPKQREERPHELNLSPKSSISESNSQHSISSTSSNEERRAATVSRQHRVNKYEKPKIVSPKHSTKMSIEEHFFRASSPSETQKQKQQQQQDNIEKPKKKITQEESTMIQELLKNLRDGYETPTNNENKTMEQTLLARNSESKSKNEEVKEIEDKATTCKEGTKTIEDTFNSIMNSLQHNVEINGRSCRTTPERTKKRTPPPTAPKPPKTSSSSSEPSSPNNQFSTNTTLSDVTYTPSGDVVTTRTASCNTKATTTTTKNEIDHDEMESLKSLLSSLGETDTIDGETREQLISMSPSKTSQSPFSLNLKTTTQTACDTATKLSPQLSSPQESEGDEYNNKMSPNTSSSSLTLEKTLLTKAPKKIDQLTLKLSSSDGRREDQPNGPSRPMTAREMRRTNRRLKSEIRNAFNEGKFNLNKKDGRTVTAATAATSVGNPHKTININSFFNGHIKKDSSGGEIGGCGGNHQNNKENILANLLEVSRQCYATENNNITATTDSNFGETEDLLTIEKSDSDAAFARIMSQAESYV